MTDFETQLKQAATQIRMTSAERSHILAALDVAPALPIPSPYGFRSLVMVPRFAFAFLALLVIGAGSAAYAAEGTLPGDFLYPVKVSVNEPIEGALATSPEAKAAWNANVATRRLDEAEALAEKGTLDATTSAELAANFNEHAAAVPASSTFPALVAAKSSSVLSAGEGSGNATATLASGNLILAINDNGSSVEPAAPQAKAMAAMRPMTMIAPAAGEAQTSESEDSAFVLALSVEAHQALTDATTTAEAQGSSTPALDALAHLVVKAEAERAVGSTTEAVADFQASLTLAADLERAFQGALPATPTPPPDGSEPIPE